MGVLAIQYCIHELESEQIEAFETELSKVAKMCKIAMDPAGVWNCTLFEFSGIKHLWNSTLFDIKNLEACKIWINNKQIPILQFIRQAVDIALNVISNI